MEAMQVNSVAIIDETAQKTEYKPSSGLSRIHLESAPIDRDKLVDELFTYHPWNDEQKDQGQAVLGPLKRAYKAILDTVPASPSRTRALNALIDARMLVNQAITFGGAV